MVLKYLLKDGLPACSTARQVSVEPWTLEPKTPPTATPPTAEPPTAEPPTAESQVKDVTVDPGPFVGGGTSSMKCSIIFSCLCVFFNMIRL